MDPARPPCPCVPSMPPCFPARACCFPALTPLAKTPTGQASRQRTAPAAQPTPRECWRWQGEPFTAAASSRSRRWELPRQHLCCLPTPWCPGSSSHLCTSLKQEKGPDLAHGSGHPRHCSSGSLCCPSAASLAAHQDTGGHQQAPSLGHPSETHSLVTSSCCPSAPAATAGTARLTPGTIPGTGGPGSGTQSAGCPAPAQQQPPCSLTERWDGSTAHVPASKNTGHQSRIRISGWAGSSEFPLDAHNLAEG